MSIILILLVLGSVLEEGVLRSLFLYFKLQVIYRLSEVDKEKVMLAQNSCGQVTVNDEQIHYPSKNCCSTYRRWHLEIWSDKLTR